MNLIFASNMLLSCHGMVPSRPCLLTVTYVPG
jgi:hypothetical protein